MIINMEADSSEMKDYPILPEGDYFIEVANKTDGFTKKKNIKKVDLMFKVTDPTGASLGNCFHTVCFIPKGEPGHGMWLRCNHALGMPYDGEVNFDTDEYFYKGCKAHITIDEWEGKKRNKISKFYPPEVEETDEGKADSLPMGQSTAPAPVKTEQQKADEEKTPF